MGKAIVASTHTKNCRQIKNLEGGRSSFSQGRADKLVTQHQKVSLESIKTSNITQTEQVTFRLISIFKSSL